MPVPPVGLGSIAILRCPCKLLASVSWQKIFIDSDFDNDTERNRLNRSIDVTRNEWTLLC